MLFPQRHRAGIEAGRVTITFRRWRRRQARPGGRYRTGADGGRLGAGSAIIEVDAVDTVATSEITESDARAAGYDSRDSLLVELPGPAGMPVYRIRFHRVDEPDPRAVLAADTTLTDADVAEVDRRLERMDRLGSDGPWTAATLRLIAARPGVLAATLAESLGREKLPFKRDVRKLKELGLTLSLPTGYRLSPRGESYLGLTTRR